MTTLPNATVLPPDDREAMMQLLNFFSQHSTAMLLGPDGEEVPLPNEVFETLLTVVDAMNRGDAITLMPVHKMLTTQEAAQFLGLSRPTVVKLLENGRIPFEKTSSGRHRRIRLVDVMNYQTRQRAERRTALEDMANDANASGLYEIEPEAYRQALKAARSDRN